MMKASVLDLRHRMKDILKALDRGEEVTILYHGKERARLVPIQDTQEDVPRFQDLPGFGIWADDPEKEDVYAYVRKLRRNRYDGV